MFISVEDIKDTAGYDIDVTTVRLAQLMIETWVGRSEVEIDDASDLATLARATLFQAIYIGDSMDDILQQAAVTKHAMGEAATTFDTSMFAPYMSPWAIQSCKRLSWIGSRTIQTGAIFDRYRELGWEYV